MPVEGNHYCYSKTYKNGNLSLAQSPVSSSPCELSDFYSSIREPNVLALGKQNGTKADTLGTDW